MKTKQKVKCGEYSIGILLRSPAISMPCHHYNHTTTHPNIFAFIITFTWIFAQQQLVFSWNLENGNKLYNSIIIVIIRPRIKYVESFINIIVKKIALTSLFKDSVSSVGICIHFTCFHSHGDFLFVFVWIYSLVYIAKLALSDYITELNVNSVELVVMCWKMEIKYMKRFSQDKTFQIAL